MWLFRRTDPFDLTLQRKYVSVVGAGGKTAWIECLAEEAVRCGKRVAITTTAKIRAEAPYVLVDDFKPEHAAHAGFLRIGKSIENGKITALSFEQLLEVGKFFDLILNEADGSKGRPLKYNAEYEPVIPPFSQVIVVVAGLDGLSGRVDEKVFRHELFEKATGVSGREPVTQELFLRFFEDDTLMKHVDREKSVVVLNKYDACPQRHLVTDLAKQVLEKSGAQRAIVASVLHKTFYGIERLSV